MLVCCVCKGMFVYNFRYIGYVVRYSMWAWGSGRVDQIEHRNFRIRRYRMLGRKREDVSIGWKINVQLFRLSVDISIQAIYNFKILTTFIELFFFLFDIIFKHTINRNCILKFDFDLALNCRELGFNVGFSNMQNTSYIKSLKCQRQKAMQRH